MIDKTEYEYCTSVSLYVGLSVFSRISKATCLNLTEFSMVCGRGSLLLWRRRGALCNWFMETLLQSCSSLRRIPATKLTDFMMPFAIVIGQSDSKAALFDALFCACEKAAFIM